jgi:Spy/CpxP family protein refolding chaperone
MKTPDKFILAAFCVGLLFGAALGRVSVRWFHHVWFAGGNDLTHKLDRFSTKMELSPDQKEKVRVILQTRSDKLNALFAELGPKIEEIRNSAAAAVRDVLTPDQKSKFDELHAKHEDAWKKSPLYHLIHDHSAA